MRRAQTEAAAAEGQVTTAGAERITRVAHRLIKRAFRTLVAMNLDVVWIAVRSSVRSPVATAPRLNWSERTWLPYTSGGGADAMDDEMCANVSARVHG